MADYSFKATHVPAEAEDIILDVAFSRPCRQIAVTTAGTVTAVMSGSGTTHTFYVVAGAPLTISATMVTTAGTTALGLVALL